MLRNIFQLSIKKKLIWSFIFVLLLPSLSIGFFSYQTAKNKIQDKIMASATQNVQLLNSIIDNTIKPKIKEAGYFSFHFNSSMIKGNTSPLILQQLDQYQKLHSELLTAYVGTESGLMLLKPDQKLPDDFDPRKRAWYKQAMSQKGNAIITPPYIDALTGKVVITIAETLNDGSGVVGFDFNLDELANLTKSIKIGDKGYPYILDQTQKFLVHPTKKTGSIANGAHYDYMSKHDSGQTNYVLNGQNKLLVFATNKLTGWKIAGTFYDSEIKDNSSSILQATLVVIIISLVIGACLAFGIIRSITTRLNHLIRASEKVSEGDLTESINIHAHDELGQLGNSFNQMKDSLYSLIEEVSQTVEQLAASAEELLAGSEQTGKATEEITANLQQLATGSDKQIESLEVTDQKAHTLLQGIQQIKQNTKTASASVQFASSKAVEGNQSIYRSIEQMGSIHTSVSSLAVSVQQLGDKSQHIGKVVQVISDIANQTNLLALNAAIEAARAGEQGRGFAVVADEVRKLSEQSSTSAKQIETYITEIQTEMQKAITAMNTSSVEVNQGIEMVNSAGSSFEEIQKAVDEVTLQIRGISDTTEKVSIAEKEMVDMIDQITVISEVAAFSTQNISASAEEQLASMEEVTASSAALAKLAENLHGLIGKFKI